MARVQFARPGSGSLRSPIAPAIQKELTANPFQQAGQAIKASQFPTPRVTKLKLGPSGVPGQRGAPGKGNPFKSQPFYGD